jgi:integrase
MQRRGDVIRLGRQHIRRGEPIKVGTHVIEHYLDFTQEKTGTPMVLPIFPELMAAIEATPSDHLTFLVTKRGKPHNGDSFDEAFRKWCNEAGLPARCTFHGLRKAGLTWGADNGWTAHELAAWSGHKTLKEVERYTKASDRGLAARRALERTLTKNELASGSVTIPNRVTKIGG